MALNPNAVPKPLIPLFRGGGIKTLFNIADKAGKGLGLQNALKRAFPRDKAVPYNYYQELVGWMTGFIGNSRKAGDYLDRLKPNQKVDASVMPKNFYLMRPDYQLCNHLMNVSYQTINTRTGTLHDIEAYFWQSDLATKSALTNSMLEKANEQLRAVSVSTGRDDVYKVIPETLKYKSAVRLC